MLRNDGDEIVLTSIKDRGIVYCRREVATCGGDSNRTGGLGVASSNLAAPTTIYLVLPNSILTPGLARHESRDGSISLATDLIQKGSSAPTPRR